MGIELPEELAGLARGLGVSWPQTDEDKLREQARAWRDTQAKLSALAADADRVAREAVGVLSGPAADAAATLWSSHVEPAHGMVTAAARGAGEAADRLDRAAERVGAAKVELVRQLVAAAKSRDTACAAASAGFPAALVQLGTVLAETAAKLAEITRDLTVAVSSAADVSTMDTPRRLPVVENPAVAEAGTGPIQLPRDQVPAQRPYGGLLGSAGLADVPTPPTGAPRRPGVAVASGFTGAAHAPSPAAPNAAPPVSPGYQPPFAGPPAGPAPAPGAMPGAWPSQVAAGFGAPPPPPPPTPRPPAGPPAPGAPPQPPQPVPPMGAPRQERESVVALFLVHMFPIGHLPVPANRPERQLPVPPPESDCAPGLRFPPHDHPRSDLIDTSDALEQARAGARPPAPPAASPPPAVTDGHDPLGGMTERDWKRRFLVGTRDGISEYAWPPGEVYPEGGLAEGEPQVLVKGTMLDRFGDGSGRVFAPEGTPFAHRSQPPSLLQSGYRRYRVLRDVPMWQTLSVGWFGQPGGGVRYRAIYSADELVAMGYLADVTFTDTKEPE